MIKTIELNLKAYPSLKEAEEILASKLDLPAYYGHNLDALYDCLTDLSEYTNIVIRSYDSKDYDQTTFIQVLLDAARACEYVKIDLEKGD